MLWHFEGEIAHERAAAAARIAVVVPVVRAAIERARDQGLCGRAWLFGSYAWGEPGERSDVDILVEGEGSVDTIAIASVIGRACRLDVHVIDAAEAPVMLRERVLSEGEPL